NRSRSRNRTASGAGWRPPRAAAWARRSRRRARFGRPVSGSWRAWWARAVSVSWRWMAAARRLATDVRKSSWRGPRTSPVARSTPGVEPLDAAIGADDAVHQLEPATGGDRLHDRRFHGGRVGGVGAGTEPAVVDAVVDVGRLEVVDPVHLGRPQDPAGGDLPLPAAEPGQPLGLGELALPLLQRLPAGAVSDEELRPLQGQDGGIAQRL